MNKLGLPPVLIKVLLFHSTKLAPKFDMHEPNNQGL